MSINPTSPHGPSRKPDPAALESARSQEAQKANAAQARTATAKGKDAARKDSVEVSAEAKALSEQTEARAKSSLPPERLKQIGERLASGHYDKPEVIAQVARRLAKDPDFHG